MAKYTIPIVLTCLIFRLNLAFGQGYTYLGCFCDNNRRETLPDLVYCNRSIYPYESCQNACGPQTQYCQSSMMTIELCRDICADQNMRYFGLQAGSQCLCGGFFAPYSVLGEPAGDDTCSRNCTGNITQKCGADFQVSVYRINESLSDCFNPGYVLNGDQSQQESSFYNATDVIDFAPVCPPPSIKNGAASITCTASGNWTNPPPTCTVRCTTPTAPIHASFSAGQALTDSSYAVDDIVFYDCNMDPSRTNQSLTCGYYGDWETTDPHCPEHSTTIARTTQPTTMPSARTTLPSTTSMATPTNGSDGEKTTYQPMVTATPPPTNTTENVTTPTNVPTNESSETASGVTSEGPPTTESATTTMSTMSPTVSTSTPSPSSSQSPSSSSSISSDGTTSGPTDTMISSPGGQDPSTPVVTDGGESTTVDSGRNQSNDMGLIPIIVGAAAGILVVIVIIIVISVCCSRKGKQRTKKIPFDPALGVSFGNPAFEDDEAEQSRRGFVQENDYGDSQSYDIDIGVSDYAMDGDHQVNRAPPDGKDSSVVLPDNGSEDVTYAVVNKNREGSVSSFKPGELRVSLPTLPQHQNNGIGHIYEGNGHSSAINGHTYYTDPNNQVATPL